MERTYTIPLRKQYLKTPKYLRTNKAVRTVRMFLQRHMKTQDVRLGEELNKLLWARGDSHPPSRVTLVAKKEENTVYAELSGKEFMKKDFAEEKKETKKGVEGALEKATNAIKGKPQEKAAEKTAAVAAEVKEEQPETKADIKPAKKAAKK